MSMIACNDCRTVCSFRLEEDVTVMTPNVKRWDIIVRISVLFVIGCMVTGGGCSKLPERLLTAEIAEQSVAEHNIDTDGFTSIEDAAAEVLANDNGTFLFLNGLSELSPASAEALAKYEGILELRGLTELSDAAAEALAKHEGKLRVRHAKLPPSASKILKDAGH